MSFDSGDQVEIFGIDLSGPVNVKDTALCHARWADGRLEFVEIQSNLSDQQITKIVSAVDPEQCLIAIDAPLSYQPGGGERPGDKALKQAVKAYCGESTRSVMAPTLTRMVYLTMRVISLAHNLRHKLHLSAAQIVEIHPMCGFQLRTLKPSELRNYKDDKNSTQLRDVMVKSLCGSDFKLPESVLKSDHEIAAAAAARFAADYIQGRSRFHWPKSDAHPFDYVA